MHKVSTLNASCHLIANISTVTERYVNANYDVKIFMRRNESDDVTSVSSFEKGSKNNSFLIFNEYYSFLFVLNRLKKLSTSRPFHSPVNPTLQRLRNRYRGSSTHGAPVWKERRRFVIRDVTFRKFASTTIILYRSN